MPPSAAGIDQLRYRGTDVGRKWQELEGLIRSPQRTRNLTESFRPYLAAQGDALLNSNEVASQVLDLFVRYQTPYRRGLGNKVFPCETIK